jgi:hypothetical protein
MPPRKRRSSASPVAAPPPANSTAGPMQTGLRGFLDGVVGPLLLLVPAPLLCLGRVDGHERRRHHEAEHPTRDIGLVHQRGGEGALALWEPRSRDQLCHLLTESQPRSNGKVTIRLPKIA